MFDAAVPTDTASSTDWNPSRFADTSPLAGQSPATVGQSPALVGESPTSAQQRCEVLSDEITTLAGHLNAAHMERLVRAYRRCRKQAESAAGKTEADAASAETSNEPEPAAIVSAETNGLETSPETGPETDEIVSAETSGGEPESVTESPAPKRTGRATALVHIAEHYLATGGSGARPLTSSEAYQVFVHVNANDAGPDNRINGAHTCYTDDRRCLAPHVVRQLACDASRSTPSLIVAVPSPNQLAGDFWIGLRRRLAGTISQSAGRPRPHRRHQRRGAGRHRHDRAGRLGGIREPLGTLRAARHRHAGGGIHRFDPEQRLRHAGRGRDMPAAWPAPRPGGMNNATPMRPAMPSTFVRTPPPLHTRSQPVPRADPTAARLAYVPTHSRCRCR